MRIAVVGVGAVGGYYGGLLAKAGHDVHFLANSDWKYMHAHGLRVDSIAGDFVLPNVHVYGSPKEIPTCDLVIVALKSTQNDLLEELVSPIVSPNGVILTLQNGMGIEESIASWHTHGTVLGGLCFLCAHKVGPGHIRHLDYGKIRMGVHVHKNMDVKKQEQSQRVLDQVAHILQESEIEIETVDNLVYARWEKLVWNIPFNGLCTLWNQTTDQIMVEASKVHLVHTVMKEVQAVAWAWGYFIPDSFLVKMLEDTRKMNPYQPSMMLDQIANRPLELNAIYEVPIARAREKRIPVPEIELLYRELKGIDIGSLLA
jgi:2-dehydropantoate 2-reductase